MANATQILLAGRTGALAPVASRMRLPSGSPEEAATLESLSDWVLHFVKALIALAEGGLRRESSPSPKVKLQYCSGPLEGLVESLLASGLQVPEGYGETPEWLQADKYHKLSEFETTMKAVVSNTVAAIIRSGFATMPYNGTVLLGRYDDLAKAKGRRPTRKVSTKPAPSSMSPTDYILATFGSK